MKGTSSRRKRDENIVWILKHLGDSGELTVSGIQARTGLNRMSIHRCLERVAHYIDKSYPYGYCLNEEGKKRHQKILEIINETATTRTEDKIPAAQLQHQALEHIPEHELLKRAEITILNDSDKTKHLQRWRQQELRQREEEVRQQRESSGSVYEIASPTTAYSYGELSQPDEEEQDQKVDPLSDFIGVNVERSNDNVEGKDDDAEGPNEPKDKETDQEGTQTDMPFKRATRYDLIAQILHLGRRKKGVQIKEAIDTVGMKHKVAKTLIDNLEEKGLARRFSVLSTGVVNTTFTWKTTEKGLLFLYAYNQMKKLLY